MEEEYFDKDCRSKRFVTTNFKKRDNKRELDERNNKIDRRLQQSLRDKYGEDYASKLENGDICTNGGGAYQIKEERKDDSDFDWSADEKKNGPKSKKQNKNSKKNKAEKMKEYEDDLLHCAPKQKGLKKY